MENKEDKILIGLISDKINECDKKYMITSSNFLDLRQRTLVMNYLQHQKIHNFRFIGGYEDAERVVVVFLPDYAEENEINELSIIRVKTAKGGKKLGHRDYLGSILALGINREMIGDILVHEDGADIIVLNKIVEYIQNNYDKAGRARLNLTIHKIDELVMLKEVVQEKSTTVASMRIDTIIASAYQVSRTVAAQLIKQGVVFINNLEVNKTDKIVQQNDKIVVRGKGKIVISKIGERTRKDRIRVDYYSYK